MKDVPYWQLKCAGSYHKIFSHYDYLGTGICAPMV